MSCDPALVRDAIVAFLTIGLLHWLWRMVKLTDGDQPRK